MDFDKIKSQEKKNLEQANQQQEIIEGLFLTSQFGAKDKQQLVNNRITHILVVGAMLKPQYPKEFIYKHIDNIYDNTNQKILCYFDEAFKFIDDAYQNDGGRVLVHW
eukprot:TRINITY_DN1158_c0_g1_i3.p1 TRINITY_DN1158_c0_g1~~TRINITY_DN1158_c0_g1_i3.p1  ORF type:complete len:107 (-),score=22.68 TRINITY_DN1158_c0_g1_i3:285-605(-)